MQGWGFQVIHFTVHMQIGIGIAELEEINFSQKIKRGSKTRKK